MQTKYNAVEVPNISLLKQLSNDNALSPHDARSVSKMREKHSRYYGKLSEEEIIRGETLGGRIEYFRSEYKGYDTGSSQDKLNATPEELNSSKEEIITLQARLLSIKISLDEMGVFEKYFQGQKTQGAAGGIIS